MPGREDTTGEEHRWFSHSLPRCLHWSTNSAKNRRQPRVWRSARSLLSSLRSRFPVFREQSFQRADSDRLSCLNNRTPLDSRLMQARTRYEVQLPSRRLVLGVRTLVMGVLNTTPDSFFKDSRRRRPSDAISRGLELEEEGADILDVGGESTRPPFRNVLPAAEEIRRVVPVIEALRKRLKIPISVDTFKAEVARAAISAGAEIVNDIGGLRLDRELPKVVASARVAVVLMHSRGKPHQMHHLPRSSQYSRRRLWKAWNALSEGQLPPEFRKSGSLSIQASVSARRQKTICCCSNDWTS